MSNVPGGTQDQEPEDRDALARRLESSFAPGDAVPGLSSWILEHKLGGGGFGEVWLARHKWDADQKPRAVKFCTDPDAKHRLVTHEQNVVVRVMKYAGKHPNIVPLLDCNLDGEVPWLMYEFVEGGTLAQVVSQWRELSLPKRRGRAIKVLHQIAGALATMHRLTPPIVHRDLKPQNVLMAGPVPRITDFGIGSVALPEKHGATTGAQTAFAARIPSALQGAGTRLYAPPEQMLGAPPNPRDDVYALGIIAYQLVLGDLNTAPGTDAMLELHDLKVPSELADLIVRSVAMNAERRPKDAGEWEASLVAIIHRATATASPRASTTVPPPLPGSAIVPTPTDWVDSESRGALDRINTANSTVPAPLEPTELPNRDTTEPRAKLVPPPLPREFERRGEHISQRRSWRLTYPRFVIGFALAVLVVQFGNWLSDNSETPAVSDPTTASLFSKTWVLTENVGVSGGSWSGEFDANNNTGWTFYRDEVRTQEFGPDGQPTGELFSSHTFTVEYRGARVNLADKYGEPKSSKRYSFLVRSISANRLELELEGGEPGMRKLGFRARPRVSHSRSAPLWLFVVVQVFAALMAHRVARPTVTRAGRMLWYWLVHGLVPLASLPLALAYSSTGFIFSPRESFVFLTITLSIFFGFIGGLIHLRRPHLTPSSPASSP
jgi:serine/threonine protein kinase